MGGAQQHGEAPVVAWTKINVNGLEITLKYFTTRVQQ